LARRPPLGQSLEGGQDRHQFVDALRRGAQAGNLLGDLARVSVDACGAFTKLGEAGGEPGTALTSSCGLP
jgi:hypothetical protein